MTYVWGFVILVFDFKGTSMQMLHATSLMCTDARKMGIPSIFAWMYACQKLQLPFYIVSPGSKDLISLMAKRWWIKLIEENI